MANSVPSVTMNGSWQDVYAATGFSIGSKLILQNKSSKPCLVWIAASAPASNFDDGYSVNTLDELVLTAGEAGCFVKGSGPLCVQVG